MNLYIQNRVAVITGASSGLGKETAKILLEEGCDVSICARNKEKLDETKKYLISLGYGDVFSKICDLKNPKEIKEFLYETNKYFGKIDIVISNTGGPAPKVFFDTTLDDWNDSINSILMSCITLFKEGTEYIKNSNQGRLIAITSIGAKQPAQNLVLSNSTRAGIHSIVKTVSQEVATYGITVNAIAPASIETDRQQKITENISKNKNITIEEAKKIRKNSIPLNRFGYPEELASTIAFLCGKQASFITGESILIDGGLSSSQP